MEFSAFIQILSGYTGLVASIFFALGIVTQNTRTMLDLSQAYWGPNPSTVSNLSNQKADYLIGFSGLFITFALQIASYLVSYFFPVKIPLSILEATILLALFFIVLFIALRLLAKRLAERYEKEINELFKNTQAELLAKGS
ncbi:hypothetical protein [Azotobacter beijerinckii]|uniref:Uncharacterized protein n=1 Tax=Azotobacter beijerinckii TaxID=170623 RepID=A0A1H6YTL3_9GAMM|nr:hypothetical protein [Azotobacter beijerinckii]SEJ44579.1 hypothetical protein SAMN04244579_04411 [Azotobacter beijerinckii]